MTHGDAKVLSVLRDAETWDDLRAAGVIFHGTSVTFSGPPRPGGYDGVLWAARTPSIAQAYIPEAGILAFHTPTPPFRSADRIAPGRDLEDPALLWGLDRCGATVEDLAIETRNGTPSSWRSPPGMPTYGDFDAWLREEMGYAGGRVRLRMSENRIMPADWRMPGRLLIGLSEAAADAQAPSWRQGDVTPHNRLGDFERMRGEGVGAFLMSDSLQSREMGNVHHLSVGILPAALETISWAEIPARRNDGDDIRVFSEPGTPEFTDLMREINPRFASVTDLPAPK